MNKKHCFAGLFCIGLLVSFFFQAYTWFMKSNNENIESIMIMEALEMTGWHEGEKQWRVKANEIISKDNIIVFVDVKDGVLFRSNASEAYFVAEQIEYSEAQKQLSFPKGLSIKMDDKSYALKKGLWDGKKKIFAANDVVLKQNSHFQMNAEQMRYDEERNIYIWSGGIKIAAEAEPEGQVKIMANKLSYYPEQKEWTAEENLILELNQSDEAYKITTPQIVFDDMLTSIVIPGKLDFKGKRFSGVANNARGTINNLLLQTVFITGNAKGTVINADKALIRSNQAELLKTGGNFDNETSFTADQLFMGNNKYIARGSVVIKCNGKTTYCDEFETEEGSKSYKIKGNIKTVLEKDTIVFATAMIFDGEKKVMNFEKINILQENEINLSADNGQYDENFKKLSLAGNIVLINKDGRRTVADKASYDPNKKVIDFTGRIKSNSKTNK